MAIWIAKKKAFFDGTLLQPGDEFEADVEGTWASWAVMAEQYKPEPEPTPEKLAEQAAEALQGKRVVKKKVSKKSSKKKVSNKKVVKKKASKK